MGLDQRIAELHHDEEPARETKTVALHSFCDLTCVSPLVFLYLLKECYVCGTCKATTKFRALQHQVHHILYNNPQPGPTTFIVQCLLILPLFGLYCEGFSHLLISALRRFLKTAGPQEDSVKAKELAAKLFLDIVGGAVPHDETIGVKILEVFDVQLANIEKLMCETEAKENYSSETARAFIEHYIFRLIDSQSYTTAVDMLEHFAIRQSGESLLLCMLENGQFRAAEKWATFMGKPMLCLLVKEFMDSNKLKCAYGIIRKNNLQQEFPDAYKKCKESALKRLAEKGCWDVAEATTNSDRQLLEYLVYLAMEAGYSEKVDELCDRYSLTGFVTSKEHEASLLQSHYLNLNELVVEDITWVDEANDLQNATTYIEGCKVVGLDCEWKPNYVKGSKPNKVSIMQIASEKIVFIVDLIKLFEDVPNVLDNCLTRILQSPRILKLGYNFLCDIKQLAHSYEELECFKHYEMLLDIQNVFKEPRGGLSGLAKKILGSGLNKTRRTSNWEQRPLTQNQLEYAALDAAVLIHIFRHVRTQSPPPGIEDGRERIEWKSYIVSHMDNRKKNKKPRRKKEAETTETGSRFEGTLEAC